MSEIDTRVGAMFRVAVKRCIAKDLLMVKPKGELEVLDESAQVFRWILARAPAATIEPELWYIAGRHGARGKLTPALRNGQYREFVRRWRRLCPLPVSTREVIRILAEETGYGRRTIERAISAK